MGATDQHSVLTSVDHWLETGLETQLLPACAEHYWAAELRQQLRQAYIDMTGTTPGGGPIWRGKGWRVWYQNGTWLDSRATHWRDVPDGIVLGVSYRGYARWMAHGVDPYWLGEDGLLYDSRYGAEDQHMRRVLPAELPRKMGIWVTDDEMRACRFKAALAFIL